MNGPGPSHGHMTEPDDEYRHHNGNNNFNYFDEQYDEVDGGYDQNEQDHNIQNNSHYYHDEQAQSYNENEPYDQQQGPMYSPQMDEEEPPSLSPRLGPEGMYGSMNKSPEEGLGYPLGEDDGGTALSGEDAALDLAELEQLQEEAERMKGLGNKHMAAQVSFFVDSLEIFCETFTVSRLLCLGFVVVYGFVCSKLEIQ